MRLLKFAAVSALSAARQLDKERYYDAATIRMISAYFAMHDRNALTKELDAFLAAKPDGNIPAEILETVGLEFYNEKNYAGAEKYLSALSKVNKSANVKPDFADAFNDDEIRYTASAGGGIKIFLNPHFALRFDGRSYSTYLSDHALCGPDFCTNNTWVTNFVANGGLIFAF